MSPDPFGPLTARGKEIEASALLARVLRELDTVPELLKRDRDADQMRGGIRAAWLILDTIHADLEERLS